MAGLKQVNEVASPVDLVDKVQQSASLFDQDRSIPDGLHIPFLDGYRAFAALLVVVSHFANRTTVGIDVDGLLLKGPWELTFSDYQLLAIGAVGSGGGQLGVMIFFSLSSFLMFHLYFEQKSDKKKIWNFFVGRVGRIFPLYYLAIILAVLSTYFLPFEYINLKTTEILYHIVFIKGNSVLWTIAPELLFYCFFGLLWFSGGVRHRYMVPLVILYVFLGNLFPIFWKSYTIEFFLIGYLMYVYRRYRKRQYLEMIPEIFKLLGFFGIIIFHLPAVQKVIVAEPPLGGWQSVQYSIIIFVIFWIALESKWIKGFFSAGLMRYLGKISFSIYLLHLIVLNGLVYYEFIRPDIISLLMSIVLITALSSVAFFFFEKPMRKWIRSRFSLRSPYTQKI